MVEKYKIGVDQKSANQFLRMLGFAIKRPMTPMASDDEHPPIAGAVEVGRPDRKVDILYGENVSCKFIRITISFSDIKYRDLIFFLQFLYIPNVEDLSLTVFIPGQSEPRVIPSGALHSWNPKAAMTEERSTSVVDLTGDQALPRKASKKYRQPEPEPDELVHVPRKLRKHDIAEVAGVARLPKSPSKPVLIWVPMVIDRSRGLMERSIEKKNINVIDSLENHVDTIELEGRIQSHINIVVTSKARRQFHTLESVVVKKKEFSMSKIDLSVVYAVFDRKQKTYTFATRKEAVSFGHTFLLFMVYPGRWFQKLFGTPSALMEDTTILVKRKRHTLFTFLRQLFPVSPYNSLLFVHILLLAMNSVVHFLPRCGILSPLLKLEKADTARSVNTSVSARA